MIKEDIENKISEWRVKFAPITIIYEYHSDTNYHIVSVGPEVKRRGDKEYMKEELKLYQEMMRKYPDENLLIKELV